MKRTDRLLAIVLELQRKWQPRAEEDFLPPRRFTAEEALILALGSEFMGHNINRQHRIAVQAACRKIDAGLSGELHQDIADLTTTSPGQKNLQNSQKESVKNRPNFAPVSSSMLPESPCQVNICMRIQMYAYTASKTHRKMSLSL